MAQIKDKY